MSNVAGIDVSKARLDAALAPGPARRFANDGQGIAALPEWLESQDTGKGVYEPTGGYELPLAEALRQAGLPAQRVHPNRVRAYAQACGLLAKTDRLDAQVPARYGAAFDAPEQPGPEEEPARAELREPLRRREQPVRRRVQERNRLDRRLSSGAAASTRRHIARLDGEIAQPDAEYQALLSAGEALSRQAGLCRSVPGIGPLTAATLAAELPEPGRREGKSLAALSGLAPWARARDSGGRRGRRSIRGGRGAGAPGVVHGGPSGGAAQRGAAGFLSRLVSAGQGQESGAGGGDAEAAAASERRGPPGHSLGGRIRPHCLKIP